MPAEVFKNHIRIRVNGILKQEDTVLLVQLKSPVTEELVWMPPGGGLQFGEEMKVALQREFNEECGLEIEVGNLAFINELVKPPFHAVECYFWVEKTGGELRRGSDPELGQDEQLLKDLKWIKVEELSALNTVPNDLAEIIKQSPSHQEKPIFYSGK